MNNKINLTNILDKCRMLNDGLETNEIFIEFLNKNLKIKKYISLLDKNKIMDEFMVVISLLDFEKSSAVDFSCNLSFRYIFNVLFAYTNIEVNKDQINVKNYDTLIQSGICDYILNECKTDYDRLIRMISDMMNFRDIFDFKKLLKSLDYKNLENNIEMISKLFENTENLKYLSNIMAFNDPNMKTIKENLVNINFAKKYKDTFGGKE